jgi:hypothetical protein
VKTHHVKLVSFPTHFVAVAVAACPFFISNNEMDDDDDPCFGESRSTRGQAEREREKRDAE